MKPAARVRWRVAVALLLLSALLAGAFLVVRARWGVVATLRTAQGQVDRDYRAHVGAWEGARVGERFVLGDGLRTRPRATATLELSGAHELSLEPNTIVRFLTGPSDTRRAQVALEMGEVALKAAEDALEFDTEFGAVRVEKHGLARLAREGTGLRLRVTIGVAELERNGERWELKVGDAIEISPTEPPRRVEAPTAPASASSPPPLPPAASALPALSFAAGLERVDLSIAAGESVVIHDPRPPTAVGVLAPGRCRGKAILGVDAGKPSATELAGRAYVGVSLASGTHHYELYCSSDAGGRGEKAATGTIAILADAGLRKLAESAPVTKLELDGRRYTVLYQNQLPKIALEWSNAPAAASYALSVSSREGTKTLSTNLPTYSFAPGALAEGEHVLSFQGGGMRSRQTTVNIRFDNAAPTASIASPANGSFTPGSNVLVSGMAQPGWVVTVGAETLEQDAQHRFSALVSAPSDRALAIRFTKAQRGVHYYLRRSAL